jgi:hypothetical protein
LSCPERVLIEGVAARRLEQPVPIRELQLEAPRQPDEAHHPIQVLVREWRAILAAKLERECVPLQKFSVN